MIDGLIGGKLHGKPAQRVGQSGKQASPPAHDAAGDDSFLYDPF